MCALLSAFVYEFSYWTVCFVYVIGFRLRVVGRRNLPRGGPVLLIANHQSLLDPIAIGLGVRRHVYYLARKTLFNNPLMGWFLNVVNCVPIDLDGVGKDGIRNIFERLAAGNVVLVFPEGNRTEDGLLQPLKPGIALLVQRTRAPIVPVGVAGAFDAWPRQRKLPTFSPLFLPKTGRSIAIVYGKPRDPATLDGLSREQVLKILHDDIAAVVERAEDLRSKSARNIHRHGIPPGH
jgi:1-acyl-sn-glycerol-3-phosphate acyltransferase